MVEHILTGLAIIIALGMIAQWIAWRTHLPAILLLLVCGFIAGPVSGLINPDEIFEDMLFPIVSLSVAIILFEGGLSLKVSELRTMGRVVWNLATVGVVITWVLAAIGAHYIAGLDWGAAILLGAVLVVTGPTVIIPLLRQVRPRYNLANVIKWEGIINDPIGAILAVIVFETLLTGGFAQGVLTALAGAFKALLAGGIVGALGAGLVVFFLKRHLAPDYLQSPLALMFVVLTYVVANHIQAESGLLAVTGMGIALANQKSVSVKQITEFKENLRALLLAGLFIILAARLPSENSGLGDWSYWLFAIVLIVIVRPITAFASARGSELSFKEKVFLSWMAPRGIVAAAVSALFALRLEEAGFANVAQLAPITFVVIICTVAVYGLSASPVARALKVAIPNPQGALIVGSHSWARAIAQSLKESGLTVALVDTNWDNVMTARKAGLRAHYANVLEEDLHFAVNLEGIGRLMAMTRNDEINSLAALHFEDLFGRAEVYQLPPMGGSKDSIKLPEHLRGRFLFEEEATYGYIDRMISSGAIVKRTPITEEFDYSAFRIKYGDDALPLMAIDKSGHVRVFTVDTPSEPKSGETLISIVVPEGNEENSKEVLRSQAS